MMMIAQRLALLSLLLSGCSLILDPEVCSSDGDCEGGAVCTDGVCLAPIGGEAGGGGEVTLDAAEEDTLTPDAEAPPLDSAVDMAVDVAVDMAVDAALVDAELDAAPPQAPICVLEAPAAGAMTAEASIPVRAQILDADTPFDALNVSINNIPIELDPAGAYASDWPLDEGEITLTLRAVDPDGEACEVAVTVISDRTAPVLTLRLPREPRVLTLDESLPVRVEIEEAHFSPRLFINDVLIEDGLSFTGETRVDLTLTLEEGLNAFSLTMEDQAGNRATPLEIEAIRDTTAPIIERIAPLEPQTYADLIEVRGRVEDAHTAAEAIEVLVLVSNSAGEHVYGDAAAILVEAETGLFSEQIALEEGVNVVRLCAFDAMENNDCAEFSIERLSDAACVTMEQVTDGRIERRNLYVSASDFTLSGSVCPNVQAAVVEMNNQTFEGVAGEGVFEVTLSAPLGSSSGVLTVNSARDSDQVAFTVLYDDSPPTLEITELRVNGAALEQGCLSAERVSVCGRVTDPQSGPRDTVTVNGESGGVMPNGDFCVTLIVDLPGDEVAGMRLVATAANRAGVEVEAEARVNIDRLPPSVAWTPEEGGWSANGALSATFDSGICAARSVEIGGVSYPVEDNQLAITLTLPDGPQTITATIEDDAGNRVEVEHSFNIDSVAPLIEIIAPAEATTSDRLVEVMARITERGSGINAALLDGAPVALEATADEGVFEIRGEVSLDGLADGEARAVEISAVDFAGLRGESTLNLTYQSAP
ncbi:hypothetical protein KKB55_05135 [Myxococcota bacterium]|nr:hypothetical protein [Myxococcota bacterium]MBU1897138.1 hypothetical protein [Myxococcota bacterium]